MEHRHFTRILKKVSQEMVQFLHETKIILTFIEILQNLLPVSVIIIDNLVAVARSKAYDEGDKPGQHIYGLRV